MYPPHWTQKFRQQYAELTMAFSAQAQVTADYGERVYEYELSLSGGPDPGKPGGALPQNIAGTGFSWSEGAASSAMMGLPWRPAAVTPMGFLPPTPCP